MLELRGIEKRYGLVLANAGIDLAVSAGSVLGLLGENGSGKSTLMKILFGMVPADAGSILFRQRELSGHRPADAMAAGIGMVHQHFMLFDGMSVSENVQLGLGPSGMRAAGLRQGQAAAAIRDASARYGLELDPGTVVGTLPLGRRQRVEIVKALMRGAQLLILDEPTSNLSPPEVAQLFRIVRRLRDEGRAVIFISHKLGEVLEICDRIVVLRDGRVVAQQETGLASRADLARLMVGREATLPFERTDASPGGIVLALDDIRLQDAASGGGITCDLRGGEILAIAGVDGNGQQELARTIAGLQRPRTGRIRIHGRDVTRQGVSARMAAGLAYIPPDRAATSLVPALSIAENLMLRDARRLPFSRHGWLRRRAAVAHAERAIRAYAIRASSPSVRAGSLSGGNQQKIVLAREIGRQPGVLVALQPTWGLDPGATRLVLDRMLELRAAGAAILYISSELEEVMALGDRIGVMSAGQLVGIVPRAQASVERIGLMMGGESLSTG